MKKEITIAVTGILAGLGLFETKQEPVVVKPVPQVYTQSLSPLCPVVGDGRPTEYKPSLDQTESDTDKSVVSYIHCKKCETGALFPLPDKPSTGRCSFCAEEFPDVFEN